MVKSRDMKAYLSALLSFKGNIAWMQLRFGNDLKKSHFITHRKLVTADLLLSLFVTALFYGLNAYTILTSMASVVLFSFCYALVVSYNVQSTFGAIIEDDS